MSTLVVSLETVSQGWDNLSVETRASLTKWLDYKIIPDSEKEKEIENIKSRLSLSPFTGEIISLAVYDLERDLSAVYFYSDNQTENFETNSSSFKSRTEKEMLEDFWEGAKGYDTFVTFNGRAFTWPYLLHRSAILKIRPTVEIAKERYVTKQTIPHHVDLLDEFTFNGSMSKRPTLSLLCGAYGVEINHELLGGEESAELFQQKKFRRLAERNESKVLAIRDLYEIWKQYFAPLSFLNTVD